MGRRRRKESIHCDPFDNSRARPASLKSKFQIRFELRDFLAAAGDTCAAHEPPSWPMSIFVLVMNFRAPSPDDPSPAASLAGPNARGARRGLRPARMRAPPMAAL